MNRAPSLHSDTPRLRASASSSARQFLLVCCSALVGLFCFTICSATEPPKLHDPAGRFEITLFAAAPQIVNPIGVQVDAMGRVFLIESHTHFRPKNYTGPAKDRILILEDTNADGVADKTTVFHEGFTAAMDLLLFGSLRNVYVAERSAIHSLTDNDDDNKADEVKVIVKLETAGNYPHNGLSGLALDGKGGLYFGLGENLGAAYKLIGSDGTTLSGEAEGGSIYHVLEDGSRLRRVATGVWNPFGICVDASGNVFATDNDPDSSPPCRLLHVVEGGDYGYEFRYGRSGLHPFQCWNGELPGTLPMLTGIGEAPCEIVPWNDGLLIASWADNRLEHYRLAEQGGSFTVKQEVLLSGDLHFRPVGIAVAKDGTLYVSDWASASYELPGTGRIWKLKPKEPPHEEAPRLLKAPIEKSKLAQIGFPPDFTLLLNDTDPFIRNIGIRTWADCLIKDSSISLDTSNLTPLGRQAWAVACKRAGETTILPELLADDVALRLIALKWIADQRLTDYRKQVEAGLRDSQLTRELFAAHLATLERLDNRKTSGHLPDPGLVLPVLTSPDSSPKVRALALLLLPPDHKELSTQRLRELLNVGDAQLSLEVVRTMLAARHAEHIHLLAEIAQDDSQAVPLRALALTGLAGSGEYQGALLKLALGSNTTLRDEALRSLVDMPLNDTDRAQLTKLKALPLAQRLLGGAKPTLPATTEIAAWLELTHGEGDAEAGERIFFHSKVGLCARCHLHSGRGHHIGPDLTRIHERATREWLLTAILQPSRDVAPAFRQWHIETTDGKQFVGLSLRKGSHNEDYLGVDGQPFSVKVQQIEERRESPLSLMPAGLEQQLTPEELRDLLAFLLRKK